MNRLFGFATVGLLAFDLVCIIIAVSIDYWAAYSEGNAGLYTGLWEACVKANTASVCTKIPGNVLPAVCLSVCMFKFLSFAIYIYNNSV